MLEDYKQLYKESASKIGDWKSITRDELAFKYIEHENDLIGESYLSALILQFWNVIELNYKSKSCSSVSEEDAYSWVISGILDALKDRCWENPESSLYNDPKGPEKAINIKCFQNKCRYYQLLKLDKRKVDKVSSSLDAIEDTLGELPHPPQLIIDSENLCISWLYQYMSDLFNFKKEYLKFFILDAILNSDVLSYDGLDNFKLRKHLRTLNDKYCEDVAIIYNLDPDCVIKASLKFRDIDSEKIEPRIERIMQELSHDDNLINFLHN